VEDKFKFEEKGCDLTQKNKKKMEEYKKLKYIM